MRVGGLLSIFGETIFTFSFLWRYQQNENNTQTEMSSE